MAEFVVFGLTISSSWGNGHATLWRGLCRALHALGHRVTFFERDVPYYREHRDLAEPDYCDVILYRNFEEVRGRAVFALSSADVAIVTSYCPDALVASATCFDSPAGARLFYDMDTPVTLESQIAGKCSYIGERGLSDYDLVLSFTGGASLDRLCSQMRARQAVPLYGFVDPTAHQPIKVRRDARFALSFLGTYAADRQSALETLFFEPARERPLRRFHLGGSMYPERLEWSPNVFYVPHVPPPNHGEFYCNSDWTLNITRRAMKQYGYCPSGRIFEAAACGVPVISDSWEGLQDFFVPGKEVMLADTALEVLEVLDMDDANREAIGHAARCRVLAEHTAEQRARQLLSYIDRYAAGEGAGSVRSGEALIGRQREH